MTEPPKSASDRTRAAERHGALLICGAPAFTATMDACAKLLAESMSPFSVMLARFAFVSLAMLPLLMLGQKRLRLKRPVLHLARGAALFASGSFFVASLKYMSLADATTIAFLAPLLVALLARPILGETVSRGGWIGLAMGFAGVLIVIRPGSGTLSWTAILPLLSALAWAASLILTRLLTRSESSGSIMLFGNLSGLMASLAFGLPAWSAPGPQGWMLIGILGACSVIGHTMQTMAFARAPASLLAPLTYVHMLWAMAIGIVLFGSWPQPTTLIGAAAIAAGGVVALRGRD